MLSLASTADVIYEVGPNRPLKNSSDHRRQLPLAHDSGFRPTKPSKEIDDNRRPRGMILFGHPEDRCTF